MDSSSAVPRQIVEALARGSTVVTANQRAARTLQHDYNAGRRALGHLFWEPPPILAWDAWLTSLWQRLLLEGHATDLLLKPTQQQRLWKAIIAADPANPGLQSIDALASTAADAWLMLHRYRCRAQVAAFPGNSDTGTFVRWAAEFERRGTRSGYLTYAQLPEALGSAISAGKLAPPSSLLLVGFDSKTPAQVALIDAIRSAGISLAESAPPPAASSLTLADAPDEYAEIAACAHWVRSHLTQNPTSRIAVIVPAIDTSRAEINRQFRTILAPELDDIAATAFAGPYEFSLGIPLAQTPLCAVALDTLRWSIGPLPIERISGLLLSPHFAAGAATPSERLARAEFDAFAVRQQHLLEPAMTVDQLLRLASASQHAVALATLLRHLRQLALLTARKDLATHPRSCARWAETFHELLDAAGFAPSASLDTVQFQTRRKWESALDELATMDFDAEAPVPGFAAALDLLASIARETLFAPESRHAPVQIMGPLESAGSIFDAAWFLGANDLAWPAPAAPNPLLSWQLQRALQMPGADPGQDAAHARRITERIAASAPVVVFSYARQCGEERRRASSSLSGIAAFTLRHAGEFAPVRPPRTPIALEVLIDDTAIPLPPDRILQGGASILKAQAECGFRAFAEKRLFATALDSIALGLDPSERGNLVHAVLDDFWAAVKTQTALKAMSPAERSDQLYRSIDHALHRHHARPAVGWSNAYLDAERQRLRTVLTRFLEYEANVRGPFTVHAREQRLAGVRIGPLRLDVRVDRIDTVALVTQDGTTRTGEIIIDYKTGPANPADWQTSRPAAPQLPLYAVVADSGSLAAIAFASVRPGKDMGMRGYQAEDGILPEPAMMGTPTLAEQVGEWRTVLESLAEDFHQGRADVSPRKYPETCTYCAQRLLCRLDINTLSADSREDESDYYPAAETALG